MTGIHLEPRTPREPSEEELAALRRVVFFKQTTMVLVIIVLVVLLGGSAYQITQIRQSQISGRATAASSLQTQKNIESCTTPGLECYERSQSQLRGIVSTLNTTTVRSSACLATFLNTTSPDETLTVKQVARRIKHCVATGKILIKPAQIPSLAADEGDPTLNGPSAKSDQKSSTTPSRAPRPRMTQTKSPAPPQPQPTIIVPTPSGSPICILGVCLPNVPGL